MVSGPIRYPQRISGPLTWSLLYEPLIFFPYDLEMKVQVMLGVGGPKASRQVGLAASCRTQPHINGMKLLQLIVLYLPQDTVLELWLENFGK